MIVFIGVLVICVCQKFQNTFRPMVTCAPGATAVGATDKIQLGAFHVTTIVV